MKKEKVMNVKIELLISLGLELKFFSFTNKGEYKGPCPLCNGKDRFTVTPDHPKYPAGCFICRQCDYKGVLSKLVKDLNGDPAKLPKYEDRQTVKNSISEKEPPPEDWQNAVLNSPYMKHLFPLTYLVLQRKGINKDTVHDLNLKFGSKNTFFSYNKQKHKIDEGLYIPNFRHGQLYGLEVRRLSGEPKYKAVKGSVKVPYIYQRSNISSLPIVIVESALDAAILYQEAGDLVTAVALGSATNRPDSFTDSYLSKAKQIFVCLDYDKTGMNEISWWRLKYPEAHIVFTPTGKDIGDFHTIPGLESSPVREWIESLLKNPQSEIRRKPNYESFIIDEYNEAMSLLKAIKNSDEIAGISLNCNYMSIAIDYRVFSIDLNCIMFADPAPIKFCAYDGIELMKSIPIDILTPDSIHLLAAIYTGMETSLEELSQTYLGYGSDHIKDVEEKSRREAFIVKELKPILRENIKKANLEYVYSLFTNSQWVALKMQTNGFKLDLEAHKIWCQKVTEKLNEHDENSNTYNKLYDRLNKFGKRFLRFYNTNTQRVHPNACFSLESTGRFKLSNYCLYNVPKDSVRSIFCAEDGYTLLSVDYSQIDFLVAVLISKDEAIINALKEGIDFHTLTASAINNKKTDEITSKQRDDAKSINFAVLYGGQEKEVMHAKQKLKLNFPKFIFWLSELQDSWRLRDRVYSPLGRPMLRKWEDGPKWRNQVLNFPIQAGSTEVMLASLGKIPKQLSTFDCRLILCIHDEILMEVAENQVEAAKEALYNCMTEGLLDIFPNAPTTGILKTKTGKRWDYLN